MSGVCYREEYVLRNKDCFVDLVKSTDFLGFFASLVVDSQLISDLVNSVAHFLSLLARLINATHKNLEVGHVFLHGVHL